MAKGPNLRFPVELYGEWDCTSTKRIRLEFAPQGRIGGELTITVFGVGGSIAANGVAGLEGAFNLYKDKLTFTLDWFANVEVEIGIAAVIPTFGYQRYSFHKGDSVFNEKTLATW